MVVYALDRAKGTWGAVQTQPASGEAPFTLEVPPGSYQVFAAALTGTAVSVGYWLEADAWSLATVTVTSGQTINNIAVRPPSQSECGSMLGFPASPDGRYAGTSGPTKECRDRVTASMAQPKTEPVRIQFAAGSITGRVTGSLFPKQVVSYALRAGSGQNMIVNLSVTVGGKAFPGGAALSIRGQDGKELLLARNTATTWQGPLPQTQDYLIDVVSLVPSAVDYVLEVTIPPSATRTP